MKPYRSMRFYHSRWLDASKAPAKVPQIFTVTRVAMGQVYYRPVYIHTDGETSRERLGKPEFCSVADFERICSEEL